MDALLGNYGSDDDEVVVNESANKAPAPAPKSYSSVKQPPVSNQPKIIPSQVINVPGQKKRKLLDISILPDHIQKALIHGETSLGDSDDDEFAQTSSSKTSSAAHGGAKNASVKGDSVRSQLDPLLAMLPAPSNKEDVLDSMFSAPKTSTRAPPSVSHQESSSSAIEAEDLGGSVGLEDHFAGSGPPLLTRQFTSEPDSKSYTPQFSAAAYPEPAYQNDYSSQPSVDVHAAGESQRKRQRHLEQMLMAGDLSALQSDDGAVVQDIHIDRQWDMLGYTEQKQKEAAIFKQYTADGTLKAALQPSRQQNRKHQLTSMAMKAAETEIAMLDSQIAKSKTKTQTKSRTTDCQRFNRDYAFFRNLVAGAVGGGPDRCGVVRLAHRKHLHLALRCGVLRDQHLPDPHLQGILVGFRSHPCAGLPGQGRPGLHRLPALAELHLRGVPWLHLHSGLGEQPGRRDHHVRQVRRLPRAQGLLRRGADRHRRRDFQRQEPEGQVPLLHRRRHWPLARRRHGDPDYAGLHRRRYLASAHVPLRQPPRGQHRLRAVRVREDRRPQPQHAPQGHGAARAHARALHPHQRRVVRGRRRSARVLRLRGPQLRVPVEPDQHRRPHELPGPLRRLRRRLAQLDAP